QIFSFHDHAAVEAFQIIDAVTPGDNYCAVMLANGRYRLRELHKADYGFILTMSLDLSSPKITKFCPNQPFRPAPHHDPGHKPCRPCLTYFEIAFAPGVSDKKDKTGGRKTEQRVYQQHQDGQANLVRAKI